MCNLGFRSISVTGVPTGTTVKSATLLWDGHADQRIRNSLIDSSTDNRSVAPSGLGRESVLPSSNSRHAETYA